MRDEKKQAKHGPLILLLIAAAIALLAYLEISNGTISGAFDRTRKRLAPEGIVFEYPPDAYPVFCRGENGFLRVTGDSATYYSFKGDMLWNDTYSIQSPFVVNNGDNWAVLEPQGRSVSVYGQEGKLYEVTTEHPILNAYINKISCLMLILEAGDSYKIHIYNAEGALSTEMISVTEGVYPVCAALSDDGMYSCVGYIDTSKASISSRLLYFYTDSGAKRYGTDDDTPFKAIEKPGELITKLSFNKDGQLAVITDSEILITTEKGEEVSTYKLQNQLNDSSFDDKMFGFIAGQPLTNADEPLETGSALLLDYSGGTLAEYPEGYERINVYDGLILLKGKAGYLLTDATGREIWSHGASDDIITIIPIDRSRAVIAKSGSAEIYRAQRIPADNQE